MLDTVRYILVTPHSPFVTAFGDFVTNRARR
jgi:hypothetical protein